MAVEINTTQCPYKGDGLAGWGKLMEGFAVSHGRIEQNNERCTKQEVDDIRRLAEDVTTDALRKVTHLTGDQKKCLVDSMAKACCDYRTSDEFTKQQAMDDVSDITAAMFSEFHDTAVPQILNKQCTNGLYNDTSTQLIMDRAYSEVQQKATALTLQNINDYFKNFSQLGATLIGFLQVAISDVEQEESEQDQRRNQDEDNISKTCKKETEDLETNRSLNLEDLAIDLAVIAVASAVMDFLITRSYGQCSN